MIIAYHRKDKIDYPEFYKNRFAGIYSLYMLGLLLYFMTRYEMFDWYKLILYGLGIQSWIPGEAMILNFRVVYFRRVLLLPVFPFLYNYFYARKNKMIWVFAIGLWLITQVFSNLYPVYGLYEGPHTKSHEFLYYFPFWHLNEFLIGNLAGIYFVKNYRQKKLCLPRYRSLFFLILLSLMFVPLFYHNGLMALLFVPAILLISANNGKVSRIFFH